MYFVTSQSIQNGGTPLIDAAGNGYSETVMELIKINGIDVNNPNKVEDYINAYKMTSITTHAINAYTLIPNKFTVHCECIVMII